MMDLLGKKLDGYKITSIDLPGFGKSDEPKKLMTVYDYVHFLHKLIENLKLKDISLSFEEGKITTLLGANGCGKSTLFKLCTKNLRPKRGIIALKEGNVFHLKRKDFAQKVAIVHQQNQVSGALTVREWRTYVSTGYQLWELIPKISVA